MPNVPLLVHNERMLRFAMRSEPVVDIVSADWEAMK
jgi:hypothetical protein